MKEWNTFQSRFPDARFLDQKTVDEIPTVWVSRDWIHPVLRELKFGVEKPYSLLFDLTAVDDRALHRTFLGSEQGASDFTLIYHLLSFDRNEDLRLKVPLYENSLSVQSITSIWPCANWYEREIWDMFGIHFDGHPYLRRILLPPAWSGHPLRKDYSARATECGPFHLSDEDEEREQEALRFEPEKWGLRRAHDGTEFMFLNVGPHHPGTHGVLRIVLQLDGEEIVDAIPEIGFHHRGKEKMGERQTWHTFIPYTDRVDYLAGVLNNFPYVLGVERLAGIRVPDRAKVIRILLAELFRISSHLVWYGTFAQDVGALSPVFYMFTDRERVLEIIEAICGARMHPSWFRIGGVTTDLPEGWQKKVADFVAYLPRRLDEYDRMVMRNGIFRERTRGVGAYTKAEAIEWGVTGPGLRACGFSWDYRKARPYSGYDQFDFNIPTADRGDCYGRAVVRIEEMRQSLRIIEQCLKNMPEGPIKSNHPGVTPPSRKRALVDIETLIAHFLSVSWGPVIPAGEALGCIEAAKGLNGYYLVSDGNTCPYRVRIRAPSFPHLQMLPLITKGHLIPDLFAVLGSMDYVLADVDR